MLRWWSTVFFLFLFLYIHASKAQQTYVNNRQLDCNNNFTTTSGYTCNGATSCVSYVTFRSQPPLYNTPTTIAGLLNAEADNITAVNNFSSNSATILANTVVVVPISNCSCSGEWYQHNASYELKSTSETYFSVANNTFEGLSTCQAMISQNTYNYRNLSVGDNITVPLRCACPTANQTAAGVRYLLTYLITWGDNYDYMSRVFGVDVQSILDANELSPENVIFPFTPILIPLTTTPTNVNFSVTPAAPPPSPPVIPVGPTGGGGSSSKWVFTGVGVGVGVLLILLLSGALFWFCRRRKIRRRQQGPPPAKQFPINPPESNSWSISSEGVRIAVGSLTIYKYEDLQKATGDFSDQNRVNGSVYRGVFNGDSAAVKIMKGDVSGEINILKQINHSNIIRLSGFCLHQGNTYLVYEFADNYSLSDWLHVSVKNAMNTKNTRYDFVLDWKQRIQIAHDIADALNYLHNFITPPYIHKNLKSSNVLLDAHMRVKITNFGLARSVEDNDDGSLQLTRHVVGTYGYMPPEYIENGLITPKMDVFALGVLIAELLSGKEAASRSPDTGGDEKDVAAVKEVQLAEMVKEVVGGGDNVREKLGEFMDSRLKGEYPVELAYSLAEIACKCVAKDLNDRPSVAEVFVTLSKILSSSLDWDPSDELEHSRSLSHGR